jgi:hypothetical protein
VVLIVAHRPQPPASEAVTVALAKGDLEIRDVAWRVVRILDAEVCRYTVGEDRADSDRKVFVIKISTTRDAELWRQRLEI